MKVQFRSDAVRVLIDFKVILRGLGIKFDKLITKTFATFTFDAEMTDAQFKRLSSWMCGRPAKSAYEWRDFIKMEIIDGTRTISRNASSNRHRPRDS